MNKQHINVISNYSTVTLSNAMEEVLNLGLNFAILPLKLDITQVLCDFKRFERTMIRREFFYGKDKENTNKPPIFKSQKTNLPTNYQVPN